MKISVPSGTYVAAVSGGVDSMVLLHLLQKKTASPHGLNLIAAHFDHGIRHDSHKDRKFVERECGSLGVKFVYKEGRLGEGASEEEARDARYSFLRQVAQKHQADAVITAHHQDDVLETAIINLLRGTGVRGLASLRSHDRLRRPLLGVSKQQILDYADTNSINWREDPTNKDMNYLRNYVRHKLLSRFSQAQRDSMLHYVNRSEQIRAGLDIELKKLLSKISQADRINRYQFIMLPHDVSKEVLAAWLKGYGLGINAKLLEQLTRAAKTYSPGKVADIDKRYKLQVKSDELALEVRER